MKQTKHRTATLVRDYLVIFVIGVILLYPIIWMFFASFKSNDEIFGSICLLPQNFSFKYFIEGWKGSGKVTYTTFFINTFLLVIPTTIFTVMSSALVAYGFARFQFPGKKILFVLLIAMLMLPNSVVIIPRYTLYNKFNWINTYMPFYAPALLCCNAFFPYMLIQFLRGLPRDLDESAYIDGCGPFQCFMKILLPLLKPALFSAGLFQFLWTWNDFFNTNIYINTVSKFPLSLALRVSIDVTSNIQWNQVMAMALVSVIPLIILFFAAQKYFVEGIATSGLKG